MPDSYRVKAFLCRASAVLCLLLAAFGIVPVAYAAGSCQEQGHQAGWFAVSGMKTPSDPRVAFVYNGVARDFCLFRLEKKRLVFRPLVAAGVLYEKAPWHSWHEIIEDGWSVRYMIQGEFRYPISRDGSLGFVISKMTAPDDRSLRHIYGDDDDGVFLGVSFVRNFGL